MMIHKNLGTAAVLLALFGLMFGLVGCGAESNTDTTDTSSTNANGDVFVADANNPADLAKLAGLLGIPMDELGELEVHRGARKEMATIYWPKESVSLDGLQSFRIDVATDYEDNARLVFKKGGKELYSEPFVPDEGTTVRNIPQSVIDAVKKGSKVKWGLVFEGRNKKHSVTGTFNVVSNKKVNRRLKKLEGSKYFLRQDATTRELMKTQVFQNTKLYSEALVQYLGILNYWPDVITPFKGIVETCRRLDLTDTPLYAIAADQVRGQGNLGRPKIRAGLKSPIRSGANGGINMPAVSGPRIPETTAPPLQQRTSDGPKPLGTTGAGVKPPKQDLTQPENGVEGTTPETEGTGPDSQAEREEWATIHGQMDSQARDAEKLAKDLDVKAANATAANEQLARAETTLASATAQAEAASEAVVLAQDAVDAETPGTEAHAKAVLELEKAQARENELGAALSEAQDARDYAQGVAQEANDALGGVPLEDVKEQAALAKQWATEAREQADAFAKQFESHFGTEQQREEMREHQRRAIIEATVGNARNTFLQAEEQGREAAESVQTAQIAIDAAQAALAAAAPGSIAERDASQALIDAETAMLHAEEALHAAEAEVRAAKEALDELGAETEDPEGS